MTAKAKAPGAKEASKEANPAEAKSKFLNPFTPGVTYDQVIASIPAKRGFEAHFKGKLTKEQISWLKNELELYKKNNTLKTK